MRRATVIAVTVLVVLAGVAVGVGAYHAGVTHGLDQAGHAERVVRVVGHGYGYGFPFGLLLLPLFFLAFFALARGGRRWGGPEGGGRFGPGPWGDRRAMLEDWHRRQHEEGGEGRTGTASDPAHV